MICYFARDETVFTHNGLGVLDHQIIRPIVYEELNGMFTLEFEYPIKAKHGNHLMPEIIVRCPVLDLPDQLFRISERNKATGGRVQIIAHHIFYDLAKNFVEDTFVVNKTGSGALAQILGATQFPHKFTATSNNINAENARMVRLNPVEIMLDPELSNGYLARWGGEIVRNNFTFTMNTARGSNNGVQIRDKKNLTGYKSNLDYTTIVTRIMPQGFDGLFLPEKYVDSPLLEQYITPKINVIKYDSVIVGEEAGEYSETEAYDLLRELAQLEYTKHQLDKPSATYNVEFAPLEKTEEYQNFSALETISLGDTVSVIHEEDGLDITARMLSYQYDPLQKRYIKIALGSISPKFTDVAKDIKRAEGLAIRANTSASAALMSANGKNTNFYGSTAPKNPQLGDVWFKENGDKMEIWIYETQEGVTQWYALSNDLTQEKLKQELAAAEILVTEAKEKADEARKAGEEAKIAGQEALEAGQAAQSKATQAQTDAQEAVSSANQAFIDAQNALNAANTASTTATTAYNKSVKATAVEYAAHTSGTTAPVVGWQPTVPTITTGQFLWTRTILTLQDNSTIIGYSVSKHGETGATGKAGVDAPTITAVREQYLLSASSTEPAGGTSYTDVVPVVNQQTASLTAGTYSNETIIPYMNGQTFNPTAAVATNTYSNAADHLVVYKLSLGGGEAPNIIKWNGRKDTSDNIVLLRVNGLWEKIGTVTATANTVHIWPLTEEQREGITGGSLFIAFFSIKAGSYAGLYNASTSPFSLSLAGGAWSDTVPKWVSGKYYWTRVTATFSDNTTTYSTPVLAEGLNGSLVSAMEAKSLSQNLQTTVTQHATAIETAATSVTSLTDRVSTAETKITQTADILLVSVTEISDLVGRPFVVRAWEQGTLNTADGKEELSTSSLRSECIDVVPARQFIGQTLTGDTLTVSYHFYKLTVAYTDFVQTSINLRQQTDYLTAGMYTNATIADYLEAKDIVNMSMIYTPSLNPGSFSGDCLVMYRIMLGGRDAPRIISWYGRKDVSDSIVLLLVNGVWEQIGTVTATANAVHTWTLTDTQKAGAVSSGNIHLAFFSSRANGTERAGIFNVYATPFTLNPRHINLYVQISHASSSEAVTVPIGAQMMRVRVETSVLPENYTGNVYLSTARRDYSKNDTLSASLLMQNNLLNLRVAKNDIVNQINLSSEGVLIAGNKIQITGQTYIDDAVITTSKIANLAVTSAKIADLAVTNAKIADATIQNAKIANLDAAKINTGTLSADRLAAGSITSAKLSVANGYITNAMIADATIASAKIAALDAGKITTGTLSADRLAANSITAAKVATNFLETLTGSSAIRITGYTVSYYENGNIVTQMNSQGIQYRREGINVGRIGTNVFAGQPTWRGLTFDLEYTGTYMCWAWRESSTAGSYTTRLTYYCSRLENGRERGFHFDDTIYFKGGLSVASGASIVSTQVNYHTFGYESTFALRTANGKAGIAMGGNHLFLGDNSEWVDFGIILDTCKKLSGKLVLLPSSINSSGQVTSWYNAVEFPTVTWWYT